MDKLPFFIPEFDYDLNFLRILAIVDSLTDSKSPGINIENLIPFIFLVKNPTLLKNLLLISKEKDLSLTDYESYSISADAPALNDLVDSLDARIMIAFLIDKELLTYLINKDKKILISITSRAQKILSELDSSYLFRIKQYMSHLKFLRNKTTGSIYSEINKALRYEGE